MNPCILWHIAVMMYLFIASWVKFPYKEILIEEKKLIRINGLCPAVFYVTITALWRVGAEWVQSNTSNSSPVGSSCTKIFTILTIDSWTENSYHVLRGQWEKNPKNQGEGRGWNTNRKSAPKNECSRRSARVCWRRKCQSVPRHSNPKFSSW